jgi:Fe2+ or Zn2+ uptake regulation protein
MHDDAMRGSPCRKILDTKSYLAASGYRLTVDGSRLLESVLTQQGPFSIDSLVGSDVESHHTAASALQYLIDFLVEIGLVVSRDDGTYIRQHQASVDATLRCAVCEGSWNAKPAALDPIGRFICAGSNFLAVVGTLQIVGICPACRSFGTETRGSNHG